MTISALEEIAETSLKRKTGARGLRAIMEKTMMDIMYQAPSDETLKSCRITRDVIKGVGEPECVHGDAPIQKVHKNYEAGAEIVCPPVSYKAGSAF